MGVLPYTVGPTGQITFSQPPGVITPPSQNMTGSPIDAAASKTLSGQAMQVAAAKSLGAGQKGASRKRRRRKQRGGQNLTASIPSMPTANSMPDASFAKNFIESANNLNAIRAAGAYDGLQNAPPMQVKPTGGFRLSDAESMYPGSGTQGYTKRSRKTKKNGSRNKRTHRRISRKSSARRSRRRRSHK